MHVACPFPDNQPQHSSPCKTPISTSATRISPPAPCAQQYNIKRTKFGACGRTSIDSRAAGPKASSRWGCSRDMSSNLIAEEKNKPAARATQNPGFHKVSKAARAPQPSAFLSKPAGYIDRPSATPLFPPYSFSIEKKNESHRNCHHCRNHRRRPLLTAERLLLPKTTLYQ